MTLISNNEEGDDLIHTHVDDFLIFVHWIICLIFKL